MILLELARERGLEPKWAASTHGGEYHSACPECGGRDRFFIQPNRIMSKCVGYYCCRQCNKHGDALQFCIDFLKLSFELAAQRIGVTLPDRSYRVSSPAQVRKPQGLVPQSVKAPPKIWVNKAKAFVDWASKNIMEQPDVLKYLANRGIPLEAVERYKIGWNPQDVQRRLGDWGLEVDGEKQLFLAKGLVVPTIESNGDVMRIKIRRHDYKDGDTLPKYMAVSGSMSGLNIIGSTNRKMLLVVESELDAYAVHSVAGDVAFAIAVGSNIKNPDNVADHYAKASQHLLICYDNDKAGSAMLAKWQRLYAHAKAYPTPMGKDIGEAIALGLDVRQWIIDG